jgi:hypothetical protein
MHKRDLVILILLALSIGCGGTPEPPDMNLHEAAYRGDLEAVRQHIAAGSNLNDTSVKGGSTPLISAATFGNTEIARALIEAGVDLNLTNDEGSTALLTAAFLCRSEIVQMLLEHGADLNVRNNAGATALDSVSAPFDEVRPVYDMVITALAMESVELNLDYDYLRATRPKIAQMLQQQ